MIEIKKKRNAVKIEVWEFCIIDNTLYLDSYVLAEKESTRHRKYNDIKRYERLSSRESTMKEDEVPFNSDIKEEALNKYFDKVKCLRWSER
mgnify:FL=1|jgi:hypothetical protein|tara:strand:- start:735 stop:1007 length:273 start_codon:yes stop_codon:yes gene_type:complete